MTLVLTPRRIILGVLFFAVFYTALIRLQMFLTRRNANPLAADAGGEIPHKVYSFSFAKYTPSGEKEIEIEGDSADMMTQTVMLSNVMAKAYTDQIPVMITSDEGHYDKSEGRIHLQKNVVATTDNGMRLMTQTLDIHPSQRIMETDAPTEVKRDNVQVEGVGVRGNSSLKKVRFQKEVTVVIQDPKEKAKGPTVITCEGPLEIDYEKNIAHFKKDVVAEDSRGKLFADAMDAYYNKTSRQVSKIVAVGNVVIENPDGNKTYSDNVIYLADEGRVILGGDAEALYFEGDAPGQELFR